MNSGSPYGSSISQSTFSFSGGGHSNASSGPSGTAAAGYRLHASQFRSFMSSHSPSASGETFTPQMRDRQARGKDPYTSGNGTDDSDLSDRDLRFGSSGRMPKEDFAQTERRRIAISYLDNPEKLMIWAQSTGDSTAGARQHWMKILCGYEGNPSSDTRSKHSQHSSYQYRSHHLQQQHHHTQRRRGGSASHQYYDDDDDDGDL